MPYCVLDSNTGECYHTTDEESAETATWVIDELRLAVQRGYRILGVYEVYEYKVTRYDPETREGVLFVGFITTFWNWKERRAAITPGFEDRPKKSDI